MGLVLKDFGFFEKQTLLACVLPKQLLDDNDFPTTFGSISTLAIERYCLFLDELLLFLIKKMYLLQARLCAIARY